MAMQFQRAQGRFVRAPIARLAVRATNVDISLANHAGEVPSSLDDIHLQHMSLWGTRSNRSCPSRHCLT
jgi:hypothetical protein